MSAGESQPRADRVAEARIALDRIVGTALAVLLATAVVNVVWQVFSRYALAQPSAGTDELARTLLVWIGLVGAAAAAGRGTHVAVDLWPRATPRVVERVVTVVAHGVVLAFASSVMIGGGLGLVSMSFELGQRSAALGLPMGAVYAALPVAGLVIATHAGLSLVEATRRVPGEAPNGGKP